MLSPNHCRVHRPSPPRSPRSPAGAYLQKSHSPRVGSCSSRCPSQMLLRVGSAGNGSALDREGVNAREQDESRKHQKISDSEHLQCPKVGYLQEGPCCPNPWGGTEVPQFAEALILGGSGQLTDLILPSGILTTM